MELTDNTYSGSEPPFRQVSSTGLRVHALGDPRDTAEVRRIVVAAVVEKSPAEEAGLKVRDRLRAVNGVRIERWKPEDLEKVLESGAAGTVVKLTIERELVEQTLELTLADVL